MDSNALQPSNKFDISVASSRSSIKQLYDVLASFDEPKKELVRPSTVEGANTLFDTVDALFGTVDREGVGNEEGANLLLLPPLWSALGHLGLVGFLSSQH